MATMSALIAGILSHFRLHVRRTDRQYSKGHEHVLDTGVFKHDYAFDVLLAVDHHYLDICK